MGGSPDTTTHTEPWDAQKPYLKAGFYQAGQDILNRPLEYFPGSTVVPYSPESRAAMGAQARRAYRGSPLLRGAQDYTTGAVGGEYLDARPGEAGGYTTDVLGGEYLGGSGAEGADPEMVAESVMASVEPAVASRFARAGRTGTSPLAAEALSRGFTRAYAPFAFQSAERAADRASREYLTERGLMEGAAGREYGRFGQERGIQEAAAGRAPGLAAEDYNEIQRLGQVGAMREAKRRERLGDQMARWDFYQNEPTRRLENYMRQIQGTYGGTSTGQGTSPNPLLMGAGAAMSLAGLPVMGQQGPTSLGGSAIGK